MVGGAARTFVEGWVGERGSIERRQSDKHAKHGTRVRAVQIGCEVASGAHKHTHRRGHDTGSEKR